MLGVDEKTVRNDTSEKSEPMPGNIKQNNGADKHTSENSEPVGVSGADAARAAASHEARQDRKAQKEAAKGKLLTAAFSEEGPFGTVVIDPPWPVEKIDRDVRPKQIEFDYPTMREAEIIAFWNREMLPRLDPHVHLFIWTTHKLLPATFEIIKAIDFRYVFTMVWHKPGGFQPHELAQYNCEFALYARKGSPPFASTKDFPCCFDGERRGGKIVLRLRGQIYNRIDSLSQAR